MEIIHSITAGAVGLAMLAMSAIPASARSSGSCTVNGTVCTSSKSLTNYQTSVIRIHMTTGPTGHSHRTAYIYWIVWCSRTGQGDSYHWPFRDGVISGTTPINRKIGHPFKHPRSCEVHANNQLDHSGHIHAWVTGRR
jgi:hypothetical protein